MINRHAMTESHLTVAEDFAFFGLATQGATVEPPATLDLHGTVDGDLTINEGATAYVRGFVGGDVYNRGGTLTIEGAIGGQVHEIAGATIIDDHAVIGLHDV